MAGESYRGGWSAVDQSADPGSFVRVLDEVWQDREDDPAEYRTSFLLLDVGPGAQVLEVGCGRGGAARALATRVGSAGRVVGVDNSATMIAEAQQRTGVLGLPVECCVADVHYLSFDAHTFEY